MKRIGVRDLKLKATQVARSVREDGETYLLTNHGHAFGVIQPLPHDWEDRILAEYVAADLKAAEEDLKHGRTVSLADALARRRRPGKPKRRARN